MIILGTNSIKDTGYDVANSVRLNGGDSAKFNIDHSGAGNRDLWTFSMWIKRSGLGAEEPLFNSRPNSNFETFCGFGANDTLVYKQKNDGSTTGEYVTNRVFRDVSAWYNLIFVYDKDNGTAGNRGRIYVNGVEETSFATENNFSDSSTWNSTNTCNIGNSQSAYFDGYMAELVFIDGQALTPTSFGEFDEDSGIWKPIDVSGLTFGTNGFYLDFEDSSNLGNDANGGTDLTEVNLATTDQSTDTCTNNFITMNPLDNFFSDFTFSDGNLTITSGGNYSFPQATIHVAKGKWYWEVKPVSKASGGNEYMVGIQGRSSTAINQAPQQGGNTGIAYYGVDGDSYGFGGGATDYGDAYAADDIIGVALDIDNLKIYFSKNGTFQNSGDPTSGSTGTGALSITAISSVPQGGYSPVAGFYDSPEAVLSFNFGSPPYAISSGNADADGFGNFEFAVPSGYFALCSKNLAEYG